MLDPKMKRNIMSCKTNEELQKYINEDNLMEIALDNEISEYIKNNIESVKEDLEPIDIRKIKLNN